MQHSFSSFFCLLFGIMTGFSVSAETLDVDAGTNQGPLNYGATGFLYGLGDEGIPSNAVLQGLRPRVVAQKALDGLQHPNGDAQKIAQDFISAGGKQIQIYMQDIYKEWPYENKGLSDYLPKIETMVHKVMANPLKEYFTYIPLNEPDVIWYGGSDKSFFRDWKIIYDKIKSLDPSARICGPNYTAYDAKRMQRFLTFAQQNGCIPDIITWHELQNDFFTQWDKHITSYRQFELDLKIPPKQVVINEYGRFSGDLGVPGHLIQYIARFERDKVDGCLAYWTSAGALNDLVVANNRPTGGWWLYQWYGDLTGQLLTVTPPNRNAEDLQGLATYDQAKKQLRILTGGKSTEVQITIRNLNKIFPNESQFHLSLWKTEFTSLNPSKTPALISTIDLVSEDGILNYNLGKISSLNAYLIMVTPSKTASKIPLPEVRIGAEDQRLVGEAQINTFRDGYTGTGYVELTKPNDGVRFVVNVPQDGFYNLGAVYSCETDRKLQWKITGFKLESINLKPTGKTWKTAVRTIFLPAGINLITLSAEDTGSLAIDGLDVTPDQTTIKSYSVDTAKLSGQAKIEKATFAPGGSFVSELGGNNQNSLQFDNVSVKESGTYWIIFRYCNGELGPGASNYNSNVVDRSADIIVNDGPIQTLNFRNTLSWKKFSTLAVPFELKAGDNKISFSNPGPGFAPNLAEISIAPLEITLIKN